MHLTYQVLTLIMAGTVGVTAWVTTVVVQQNTPTTAPNPQIEALQAEAAELRNQLTLCQSKASKPVQREAKPIKLLPVTGGKAY